MIVVIFGVSGAGKTTLGELLAQQLHWKFYDADDSHPVANIDKIQRGEPLTDEDRQPWLQSLRAAITRSLAANEHALRASSASPRKDPPLSRAKAYVQ